MTTRSAGTWRASAAVTAALVIVLAGCGAEREGAPPGGFVVESPAAEVVPWTHLDFRNRPENFQFLVVSDRTGGHREGVFPSALAKARLLQPEFIISVGDLIEGYTDDESELKRQWDEFEGFFTGFELPFFYVPGNHDLSNPAMVRLWTERFGRDFYHFLYQDVLFLCLNSEDGARATLGTEQLDYFRRILGEYPEPRWTLVFIHRPLWTYDTAPGWSEFEGLLQDRPYTVFAGHNHRYEKVVRKDRRYITLATTGGVSDLRGPDHGEFDQVAWITLSDEGPVLANLLLDGIREEDVRTDRSAELMERLTELRATALLLSPAGLPLSPPSFRLDNGEDVPMRVRATAEAHPLLDPGWSLVDSISPRSVAYFLVPLVMDPAAIGPDEAPLRLTVITDYAPEDHRPLKASNRLNLAVSRLRSIASAPVGLAVDGDLSDWPALEYRVRGRGERGGALKLSGFNLNLTVVDRDDEVEEGSRASWQPAWHTEEHVVGAGGFMLD